MMMSSIEQALKTIHTGGMVIVVDDEDRENEGDLVLAAEFATPDKIAFITRYCTGIICAPMTADIADRLELPLIVKKNNEAMTTAFTVPVDLIRGTSTGVSARDRAATLRALADPSTPANALARPGHIFPLRARPGGVLERPGHTEASVDLCRYAGLSEVAVICELVNDDGTMSRLADIELFAARFKLPVITINDLIEFRRRRELIPSTFRLGEARAASPILAQPSGPV